ncbi:chemosensory pili system protein ChpB (putative protein-glutamate methylesterase) [Tamilnaduibacter salinus]|uniref:protein-glutamate methylesterase n=1 Tax=Tamilnaduibacter salinus TaxID=1484056 RepID=A0A2U1CYX1_9GAMM|nr:chemotaxis protein CheB [Tamilnaduibacter salinus]PVY77617.1 chemosensory pili system protein ChpB (putative protein-glutamate methylesterase) [Tamilnaduibacter salinus]
MTGKDRQGVAILSDCPLQRGRLQEATGKFGLTTTFIGDSERLMGWPTMPEPALWLLSLKDEADHPALFDYLLERTDAPILFGLDPAPDSGSTEYFRWERRLLAKLEKQLGPLEQLDDSGSLEALDEPEGSAAPQRLQRPHWIPSVDRSQPAEEVWMLGASLGGPAAIKAFLDQLPEDLPVGFVYAQHIDDHFTDVLGRVLGRHAHYSLKSPEPGDRIYPGDVVLMPVENEWMVDREGRLQPKDNDWPGPYGPSIDQVLLNMADYYGARCHAILFSGMGNDGAIAAPLLRAFGSRIWVQESASCGNSSMPDSVAATGCASFAGTPGELARQLVQTIEESCLLRGRPPQTSA